MAARIMYLRNVKRLPVVDADGRLAGIVSRADVLAVYSRTDADIAEEIRTGILSTETPANPGTLDVSVKAGVATIVGRPQTREQGHAIIGRARHVQGVVAVRDRLDYPVPGPPTSTSWPASRRTDPAPPTWRAAARPSAVAAPGTWSGSGA